MFFSSGYRYLFNLFRNGLGFYNQLVGNEMRGRNLRMKENRKFDILVEKNHHIAQYSR